jgi:sirohydrochlorin ferrochelatase
VELYKQRTGHPIVEPAHMELAEPSIGTAFKCCVEQGATRVIICPYFLFPGRHWDKDIPALAAQAAEQHTGVPYVVTAPIGLHELMVRVVEDRMQYCMSHVVGKVAECSMCAGTGRCQQLTSNPRPTMSTNSSNN